MQRYLSAVRFIANVRLCYCSMLTYPMAKSQALDRGSASGSSRPSVVIPAPETNRGRCQSETNGTWICLMWTVDDMTYTMIVSVSIFCRFVWCRDCKLMAILTTSRTTTNAIRNNKESECCILLPLLVPSHSGRSRQVVAHERLKICNQTI